MMLCQELIPGEWRCGEWGDAGWLRPDLVWAGNYVWLEHYSFVDVLL